MRINIMNCRRAWEHEPEVPTLAMRIHGSPPHGMNHPDKPLRDSPLYVAVCQYEFDDQDPVSLRESYPDYDFSRLDSFELFTPEKAERILADFEKHRDDAEELMVHCSLGAMRSPAVAIALNEIYGLGYDTDELKDEHDLYNKHVYKVIKEVAYDFW